MKRELRRWEAAGFLFTGALGTLLHFVYDWSGRSRVAAAFSAVNESTWEHMKLLFIPFLLFAAAEFIVFSEPLRNFFAVKAAAILLGLAAIPALFYTLTGMFGRLPDWMNIAIFFLADALAYFAGCRMLMAGRLRGGAAQRLVLGQRDALRRGQRALSDGLAVAQIVIGKFHVKIPRKKSG